MSRIYVTPLPDGQATTSDEGVRARIQQSGLLEESGTAVEKISAENIDLVVNGRINLGAKFSEKIARELESLGESTYSGLPYFNPDKATGGRNAGYYELERVDVSPSHPKNSDVFEYTAGFAFTGTRETHWRSVATREESIGTGLATGSSSNMGIPSLASKVRWYDSENGKEPATATSTVNAEFGDVDLYDPDNATASDPYLIYEIPYSDESPVDVRVYDTRGLSKYYTVNAQDFNQWTHSYHTSFEFEGNPLVDNGLHRVEYDEPNGVVDVSEWNNATSSWDSVTVSHTDWTLIDADFESIGPTDTRAYCEFQEAATNDLYHVILSHQRGLTRPVARGPEGEVWNTAFETYLDQFTSDVSTDVKPSQGLRARSETK